MQGWGSFGFGEGICVKITAMGNRFETKIAKMTD
jgi:hypothetical protein